MSADNVTELAAAELYRAAQRNWKRDPGDWNRVRGDVRDWHMGLARALDAKGLLATPEREAVAAAKVLREAAGAMRGCKRPGHWNLDAEPGFDTGYSPDVWLVKRADRIERAAGSTPEHDAGVAAKAWSEGFRAGRRADHNSMWWPPNPYRIGREAGESDA